MRQALRRTTGGGFPEARCMSTTASSGYFWAATSGPIKQYGMITRQIRTIASAVGRRDEWSLRTNRGSAAVDEDPGTASVDLLGQHRRQRPSGT